MDKKNRKANAFSMLKRVSVADQDIGEICESYYSTEFLGFQIGFQHLRDSSEILAVL